MSNNGSIRGTDGRKNRAVSAILALLAIYSAVSFAILLIWGKLPPAPLVEYEAFAYIFGRTGKIALALLISALWLIAIGLCVVTALMRRDAPLPVKIALTALVAVDLGIHIYAFLSPGATIAWNYLVSATLDGAMIFCVLAGGKTRE